MDLNALLRSSDLNLRENERSGPVQVTVDLHARDAEAACLRELESLGLDIKSVAGNKVIGSVEAARLPALRGHAGVREVETSVRLQRH